MDKARWAGRWESLYGSEDWGVRIPPSAPFRQVRGAFILTDIYRQFRESLTDGAALSRRAPPGYFVNPVSAIRRPSEFRDVETERCKEARECSSCTRVRTCMRTSTQLWTSTRFPTFADSSSQNEANNLIEGAHSAVRRFMKSPKKD
jgi:hypothetical protein